MTFYFVVHLKLYRNVILVFFNKFIIVQKITGQYTYNGVKLVYTVDAVKSLDQPFNVLYVLRVFNLIYYLY